MADTVYSIFSVNGTTIIGEQVYWKGNAAVQTLFPATLTTEEGSPVPVITDENYIFIKNPATIEFNITQSQAAEAATLRWNIMPYIPQYVKSTREDYIFAFPKAITIVCGQSKEQLISDVQAAYKELA